MNFTRKLIVALLAGLLAGALLIVVNHRQGKALAQGERQLQSLRGEFDELSRSVQIEQARRARFEQQRRPESAEPARDPTPFAKAIAAAAAAEAAAASAAEHDPSRHVESASEPSIEEVVAHIDAAFESERIDADWSAKAQVSLREHVNAVLPAQASIVSSECRGTLCRTQLAMPDMISYRKFVEAAFHDPDKQLPENGASAYGILEQTPNGITMIAYTARANAQIPMPAVERTAANPE